MSKMSELHAEQETLDKINASTVKRADFEVSVAVTRLCNTDTEELVKEGITATHLKTYFDMLFWKMLEIYKEDHKDV